jgi:hypothetical protein
MKVMRRSRRLARLAAMLVVGMAGLVVAASAPARAGIVFQSHVVASWGFNKDGDLGDGTTVDRYLYGDIKLANDVTQVAAGYYFGLALRSDGTVWAWGDNGSGQLGDGTTTDRSTPGRVLGPDGVVTPRREERIPPRLDRHLGTRDGHALLPAGRPFAPQGPDQLRPAGAGPRRTAAHARARPEPRRGATHGRGRTHPPAAGTGRPGTSGLRAHRGRGPVPTTAARIT